jgi:hypothetical protein
MSSLNITSNTQPKQSAQTSKVSKPSFGRLKSAAKALPGTNGTNAAALSLSNPDFGNRNQSGISGALNLKSFLG